MYSACWLLEEPIRKPGGRSPRRKAGQGKNKTLFIPRLGGQTNYQSDGRTIVRETVVAKTVIYRVYIHVV